MAERKLKFVGAGDQDVSEVTISTGTHRVSEAEPTRRVTYTISYPSEAINKAFKEAAEHIIEDAKKRGVEPGQP
ncbi:hypothetical protein [Emcibacter nanhaiensis]|uniref:Uncharacterized protein n=1 Tax=Emcibacter nanhaiensis TaxID=1505037 RepID=A0A501PST4_9PROT|nr:hypothetical protein [Emcibacter nanhaiensis]TPD63112.1 hypothetical protein FIV46_03265 [Emcibacter nanhaiensis]